jgi:hypothetical protein
MQVLVRCRFESSNPFLMKIITVLLIPQVEKPLDKYQPFRHTSRSYNNTMRTPEDGGVA